MSEHRALGERIVAAADPKFRDFRLDFERISSKAAALAGRELSKDEQLAMFLDGDWDIRIPLQALYAEKGAVEAVAHYHAKQFKLIKGRNQPWPDEPAEEALRLFARHGRAELGVALIRSYLDMQHKRLQRDFSSRSPRGSRKVREAIEERAIASINQVIADKIPERKAELLRDLETVIPYLEKHGSDDDKAWLANLRREVWMEQRA
jgi:hypothetical protein